jgi:hypothetical protein
VASVEPAELKPKALERIDREQSYSVGDWEASAGHRPLAGIADHDLTTLIFHWRWSEAAQAWFYTLMELERESGRDPQSVSIGDPWSGALMVYYGLVWAVIERLRELRVRLRGQFNADIRSVADDLRGARNAVFHVSRGSYEEHVDDRLLRLMANPERQRTLDAVHLGLGRLIADEAKYRTRDVPS